MTCCRCVALTTALWQQGPEARLSLVVEDISLSLSAQSINLPDVIANHFWVLLNIQ
jgi:hypothetical protein